MKYFYFISSYQEAAKSLAHDAQLNTDHFSVCENVDLPAVFEEYEAWHVVKVSRFYFSVFLLSVIYLN